MGYSISGKAGRWLTAHSGEFISIPANVKHALRNTSSENTSLVLVTTPNIYEFFRAIANPVNPDSKPGPLTPADMERLMALSAKHNYWLVFAGGKRRNWPDVFLALAGEETTVYLA